MSELVTFEEFQEILAGKRACFTLRVIHAVAAGTVEQSIQDKWQEHQAKCQSCRKLYDDINKVMCRTCHSLHGKPRVDNGLSAGVHCDACWDDMVRGCRSRSW